MSEFKGLTRHGRRVRFAAMIVGAALALPSLAVANHTTCNKQSNDPATGINCPEFSPGLDGVVSNRVIDSESTLSYEYSQADHESSTMLIEAYVPLGWQFNTEFPASGPGACDGTVAISGNSWRRRHLSGTARTATEPTAAAYFEGFDPVTQTISACARFATEPMPFTISKISGSHPYAATHGWKIRLSTRAFVESIKGVQGSMTRLHFDLNERTGVAGTPASQRQIFSRASDTPVTTDLRVDATTCRRGFAADGTVTGDPIVPADAATGCRGNATLTTLVTIPPFNISPAPTVAPLDFGQLTGPNRLPNTVAEGTSVPVARNGFGLVHGSNSATVTWTNPATHPDETLKAYALIISIPGNQGSRSGRYILAPATSTVLTSGSLPRIDGNGSLNPDFDGAGKYDLALITIFASGKRSDGLCDDGSVFGALCAPTTPLWQIRTNRHPDGFDYPNASVGTSTWQFLWRTKLYSSATVENISGAPFTVLFVDYTSKEAEFVIWGGYFVEDDVSIPLVFTTVTVNGALGSTPLRTLNPSRAANGPGTSFKNRSNLISGDGKDGVVVFSNSASPTGGALRFDYVGETNRQNGSRGVATLTDPRNPRLQTGNPFQNGNPYSAVRPMQGANV